MWATHTLSFFPFKLLLEKFYLSVCKLKFFYFSNKMSFCFCMFYSLILQGAHEIDEIKIATTCIINLLYRLFSATSISSFTT